MGEPAISVQAVSKRYRIHRQRAKQRARYATLAESISRLGRDLLRGRGRGHVGEWEDFTAVDDVSFDVNPGDVVGLIGRNGAGKSTILKLLTRISEPTAGRIVLNGRVASLLEVGTGFHPELTGRENIWLNGAMLGMSRAEIARKFDEIVDFSGVERFLETPVKRYSSGMYVRLAFAVAAHLDPEILLVDEVLAVGDAAFQKKCMGKMNDVAASEGRTIVFVSHSMPAIQRLCSRAILLERGRIEFAGGVDEAVRRYLSSVNRAAGHGADLQALARRTPAPDVMLVRCVVLDSRGAPCAALRVGEPFGIHVEIRASRAAEDLSLSVGIETSNLIRIATMRSEDMGPRFRIGSGETAALRVHVDELPLSPGSYSIALNLRERIKTVDSTPQGASFEVTDLQFSQERPVGDAPGLLKQWPRWEAAEPFSEAALMEAMQQR